MLSPTCRGEVSLVITFQNVCEGVKEIRNEKEALKAAALIASMTWIGPAHAGLITKVDF